MCTARFVLCSACLARMMMYTAGSKSQMIWQNKGLKIGCLGWRFPPALQQKITESPPMPCIQRYSWCGHTSTKNHLQALVCRGSLFCNFLFQTDESMFICAIAKYDN